MILICISLMTNDMECLFICLLTICMSFFSGKLLISFAYVLIRLVISLLGYKIPLYVLHIST